MELKKKYQELLSSAEHQEYLAKLGKMLGQKHFDTVKRYLVENDSKICHMMVAMDIADYFNENVDEVFEMIPPEFKTRKKSKR